MSDPVDRILSPSNKQLKKNKQNKTKHEGDFSLFDTQTFTFLCNFFPIIRSFHLYQLILLQII